MTEGGLRFEVHGKPRPKGSMRVVGPHGRGGMKESNPESAPWREAVRWAASRAMAVDAFHGREPFDTLQGPIQLDVVFAFTKPASAPKRRRIWPVTRSTYDLDKLLRNVGDALVDAQVIKDDSQIVHLSGAKVYCGDEWTTITSPGATITVAPVRS